MYRCIIDSGWVDVEPLTVLVGKMEAGKTSLQSLVKKWLTRYDAAEARVLTLGPVVGVTDRPFAIEDIFTDDFYTKRVWQVYSKELSAAGIKNIDLKGSDQLIARVQRELSNANISFNKGSVAKIIRRDLIAMKSANDLPAETQERAAKLIEAIVQATS
ncbi:MAG: hypothetical protein PXY39_02915 [archaeon]|nr:hypothetical protein [archaeon]